ncbi:unnamed protein product [Fusarium venenatum]|uniref:Uncharacterized protein n=1 Tax=Fusarium venenatum TaxID=56646 RepID=A0A2L2T168_9HYPO|nr:uncharacterized protein FVRRES_05589 [Fusarium venenatum]CEI61153.1 unnamed protein product [Fusarium venenatum]
MTMEHYDLVVDSDCIDKANKVVGLLHIALACLAEDSTDAALGNRLTLCGGTGVTAQGSETWPTVAVCCDVLPTAWAAEWRVEAGGCVGSNTSLGSIELFAGAAEHHVSVYRYTRIK